MKHLISTCSGALRRSIGTRIVALFLGLLLAVQLASFTAIRGSMTHHAYSVLPEQLQMGERVLQRLLAQQAQTLTEGAQLLAADYGFRSAVLSNDVETIASVLANHGARIGASESALLDTSFMLKATAQRSPEALAQITARLAPKAMQGGSASEIALIGGHPHQLVLVPMKAPLVVGWVLMGFPIDAQLATDMKELSGLNLTLLARSSEQSAWSTPLTSLAPHLSAALANENWNPPASAAAGLQSLTLDGEALGVRSRWLSPRPAGLQAAQASAVLAVLSLSIDEAVRPPRDMQLALLAITLIGFAVFTVGSLLTARRVTQPLRELTTAAERLGKGDFESPLYEHQGDDEIGQLARTFETMRINVAQSRQQILQLAYWDSLTGLPNRVQFRNAVREAIEALRDKATAGTADAPGVVVLMLDLDRFKHVNDVLGYRFGDLLLMRVAERLVGQVLRAGDLVARLGGDEFAVLLKQADAALGVSVAKRIAQAFEVPLKLEEHTVDITAGIGMACWPEHAPDADVLLSRAEVAMYAAKQRTAGPLMYDASIDAASAQTLSLLTELRRAVDNGELRLYLQPKLALDTATVVGAEALVRWQHPTRGLVPPGSFIPFAEQTGFIRTLTMWIFEEAARHWLLLLAEGMEVRLSVNLSTRDLLDQDLPTKFDALLIKHQVPAEAFCLEITESAIMDDPQRALGTLNRLSAMGFKLSIDDFGTGYSSLAYLKRLPVDELKIDQSFVMSMETDPDDAKIVRSTIDLAHNLGLTVVAEGVENAKVWSLLRDLNCDQAQGYHMGKPMPAAEFQKWNAGWLSKQRPQSLASALTLH